jgi:RNA polymerase subunit RPABC4/transcription elongation factor Spt4
MGAVGPAVRQDDASKVRCAKCGEMFPAGSRFCPIDGTVLTPAGGADRPSTEPPNAPGMVCPKCHRGYGSDARFCPHDSAKLVPYPEWRVSQRGGR